MRVATERGGGGLVSNKRKTTIPHIVHVPPPTKKHPLPLKQQQKQQNAEPL